MGPLKPFSVARIPSLISLPRILYLFWSPCAGLRSDTVPDTVYLIININIKTPPALIFTLLYSHQNAFSPL